MNDLDRRSHYLILSSVLMVLLLAACNFSDTGADAAQQASFQTRTLYLPFHERPTEVTFEVIGDQAIFEGDIILGDVATLSQTLESQGVAISGSPYRWPGGIIPYAISSTISAAGQATIADAIKHWEEKTSVDFIPRTRETDYVEFVVGKSDMVCSSFVGRQGGRQMIELSTTGDCGFGATVHEIGHALGLWHEQSRSDRDQHVTIQWANITPEYQFNFEKHLTGAMLIGAYDFGSIMHYSCYAFSVNGGRTIELVNPPTSVDCYTLGQRGGLSTGDIASITALYPFRQVQVFASNGSAFNPKGGWLGVSAGSTGWTVGDFTGNGKDDIFRVTSGGVDVYASDGAKFVYKGKWTTVASAGWTVGDFDGNGRDDIFRVNSGGVEVYASDSTKFVYKGRWTTVASAGWKVGDFTGDGRDDIFRVTSGGVEVYASDGTKFVYKGRWTTVASSGWAVGDFTGDGKDDIFRVTSGGVDVYASDGTKFVYKGRWTSAPSGSTQWRIGDFTGDGREELLRQIEAL